MPVIDEKANQQARAAMLQLLDERPEFRDTRNNQVHDLIPFLEIEENSEEWLPQFENNARALSNIWHNVVKNWVEKEKPAPVAPPTPPQLKRNGNGASKPPLKAPSKPVEKSESIAVSSPASVTESPVRKGVVTVTEEAPPVPPEEKPKPRSAAPKAEPRPVVEPIQELVGEVVEPSQYQIVLQSTTPPALEERALQAGQALAEQFAIVHYHEAMLEQSGRTIEELTEALARARQAQTNAAQAYANSLEDLARLMATSLGPKAGDFGKLFARIIGNTPGKK